MTRMLFWNVELFGNPKFYSTDATLDPLGGGLTRAQTSASRQALLYAVLTATNPDVIVFVEVAAERNPNSRLAADNGGVSGMLSLLAWLRGGAPAPLLSPEWRAVPPFWLAGVAPEHRGLETVAVFYRGVTGAVTRYFTGPNIWPGPTNVQPQLPGAGVPTAYGALTRFGRTVNFNAMLVPPGTAARPIPPGALHNGGLAEDTVAARFKLQTAAPAAGVAPVFQNFGTARPPLMVTLTEDNAGALRNLTLFAVHAPADDAPSRAFLTTLGGNFDVTGPLGANETRIVGGDFNSQLLTAAGVETTAYLPLTNQGFQLLLRPAGAPPPPAELDTYAGFFSTHFWKIDSINMAQLEQSRFLWSDTVTPAASPYPGYGYRHNEFYSLDNVLVNPPIVGHAYQTTIMNTMVGSPLNGVPPPAGAPIGTIPIPFAMGNLIVGAPAWPQVPDAAPFVLANANLLLGWPGYGHIVSTTDHFALFVDV